MTKRKMPLDISDLNHYRNIYDKQEEIFKPMYIFIITGELRSYNKTSIFGG